VSEFDYYAYLHSPWWTARKAALIRARGYRCERCGVVDRLHVHHRTYERLTRELPEDLELLCRWCHMREHGLSVEHEPWGPQRLGLQEVLRALSGA